MDENSYVWYTDEESFMASFWFTSDTHFNHENIIEYSKRPFKTLSQMNEVLIKNWNQRVKPEDTIFFLGDFGYRTANLALDEIVGRLLGKIIYVQGNHDGNNGLKTPILDMTLRLGGTNLRLIHDPADVGYFGGGLVLCGHVHENWRFQTMYCLGDINQPYDCCNVGVDVWDFKPVSINEILNEYRKWKKDQPEDS